MKKTLATQISDLQLLVASLILRIEDLEKIRFHQLMNDKMKRQMKKEKE